MTIFIVVIQVIVTVYCLLFKYFTEVKNRHNRYNMNQN
jgi:hypothetical protein